MNVFEASLDRMRQTLDEFDGVYVSFSGGKDSGIMVELMAHLLRTEYKGRKVGLYQLDYEGQYQSTTDYVDLMFKRHSDVFDCYWCCMPVTAQCSVSMYQSGWVPWNKEEKEIWTRDIPKYDYICHEDNNEFGFFEHGMADYTFNSKFHEWYKQKTNSEKVACMVGIRTDESLNRWIAVHGDTKRHNSMKFTSLGYKKNLVNSYPIYDWKVEDIWAANAKNEWPYNKLYDLFHMSGMALGNMRVASPFNDCAHETLNLYKAIEPNTWSRLVGRVNGANFTAIYGGTKAMAFKDVSLPKGHTWKTYCDFLLSTLPENTKGIYEKKFNTSLIYWTEKGGAVNVDTVRQMADGGFHEFKVLGSPTSNRKYTQEKLMVVFDYYPDDLDIKDFKEIPTYKRMCITILKNDTSCKYMGFGQTKDELAVRGRAEIKYKNIKQKVEAKND